MRVGRPGAAIRAATAAWLIALPAFALAGPPEPGAPGGDGQDAPSLARLLERHAAAREVVETRFEDQRRTVWTALERFYAYREHVPAWSALDGSLHVQRAGELLDILRQADRHGLTPADYDIARLGRRVEAAAAGALDRRELLALDTELTAAFLTHALHRLRGRVDPHDVDTRWYVESRQRDLAAILERALQDGNLGRALDALDPPHPGYRRLAQALARYRELAAGGAWPRVPEGPPLEAGDRACPARLEALAGRLAATGDLEADPAAWLGAAASQVGSEQAGTTAVYDEVLAEALRRFQDRHELAVDGVLGPRSMAALNVPVEERIRSIELNLERWRWLPQELGRRHVRVNVASQQLEAVERGQVRLRMRVVVGEEGTRTPVFSDRMTHVVINPYWYVPMSIVDGEIRPQLEENPDYLAQHGYERYGDEDRIRQVPGPTNALGRIKFMFPNRFAIYLHDTPAGHLFARNERFFSHGCVRVEKPVELAGFALDGREAWSEARVRREIAEGERQRVDLASPLPVYLLYWTAEVAEDGTVRFIDDLYRHDDALLARLAERAEHLDVADSRPAGSNSD